jgi:NAD(P)H-hydrate epimerase
MEMDETHLVNGSQMASIDRRAIRDRILSTELMESAGQGISRVAQGQLNGFNNRHIAILCGKGNNGGDGFVVARLAAEQGAFVQVFLFASPRELKGDARINLGRIAHLSIASIVSENALQSVQEGLSRADLAIDGLLGTGINRPIEGLIARAIGLLKHATCPIIAIDVPSGLDSDTGSGDCATATHTVTFACPRVGHFFYPGRKSCGRLHLVDIGIPSSAVRAENCSIFLTDAKWASRALPHREPTAHKGDCGHVYILAGSLGMTGAAALCATSAARSGAGLVTLGIPTSLNDILECKVTEVMTRPYPEVRKARCFALNARGQIASDFSRADAIAIGPGLGTHRETVELVRRLINDFDCPAVIDADALNALVGHQHIIQDCRNPLVLTPHPGEFSRLSGQSTVDVVWDPIESVKRLAKSLGHIIVLKGAPSLVADPMGRVYVNPTGNAGMATGGTGDVLTGLIASLIGQGLSPLQAARLGVYVHGLSGDLVSKQKGQFGLIAGDLVLALPDALIAASLSEHPDAYPIRMA